MQKTYVTKRTPKSQLDLLLKHFKEKKSITAMEAHTIYRIRSLSRRICDLRGMGHDFKVVTKHDPTGQRYVRYTLVK